ncbi:unnamed protein product [Linum trigynum]|uniref:MADS-box domain-containing protein n=1 Tax=Linum trigynum TaxID=586398 RepID=A0AAV2GSW7_9ROSI
MGRKKVEIKRISDKSSRQVTFSKRRSGLIKKAREISVLCDVQVALLVFSARGRLYDFSAGAGSLTEILKRYRSHTEAEASKAVNDAESTNDEVAAICPTVLLQIVQRFVVENPADVQLTLDDFVLLEEQLDLTLKLIRARKKELMLQPLKTLQEEETKLKEENEVLKQQIAAAMEEDAGDETNAAMGTIGGSEHDPVRPETLQLLL